MNFTVATIFGIAFIFFMTTFGSAVVFFFKKQISEKWNSIFLGFASGIMVAASVWSMIIPAIEGSASYGALSWLPAAVGLVLGGIFLAFLDKIILRFKKGTDFNDSSSQIKKSTKLFLAVTVHNIPEGLAVGFAFGAAAVLGTTGSVAVAIALAVGIGIQNLPEGAAVSLPLVRALKSRKKAFCFGLFSGAVEPVFAVIGYFLATYISALQPWLLSFAAGAMLFVVADDLIPDAKLKQSASLGAWGFMAGFVAMMILDVALG